MRARILLYASLAVFTAGIAFGSAWDLYWHSIHRVDNFFTPPHLFIYSGVAAAGALAITLAVRPELSRWFGPAYRLPLVPFPVPGSIMMLGFGVAVTLIAGGLDDWWHTSFGQNETRWSLPHAMLAWGIYVAMLGFLSCRLAMRAHRPMSRFSPAMYGVLLLAFSMAALLGPLFLNTTPEAMARLATMQGFSGAETLHLFRIIDKYEITRANPFYPALAALWAGAGIAVIRAFDPRPRTILEVTALATILYTAFGLLAASYIGAVEPWGTWLPPVVLPAAAVLLYLDAKRLDAKLVWFAAGAVLGVLTFFTYGWGPLAFALSLLAGPMMIAGWWVGERIFRVVKDPTPAGVGWLVPLFGAAMPVLVGLLDLYMRSTTA